MLVLVYGTLKKGFKNHDLLNGQFISNVKTKEKYSMFKYKDYDFPYVCEIPMHHINGELYDINNLKDLDILEGYPDFYTRKIIKVIDDNNEYEAYIYILNEKIKHIGENFKEWRN